MLATGQLTSAATPKLGAAVAVVKVMHRVERAIVERHDRPERTISRLSRKTGDDIVRLLGSSLAVTG